MNFVLLAILTIADPASASTRQNIPNPVEQGVGDVNPLAQSQRVLPVDLFVPTRFEKVYRLEDVIRRGDGLGNSAKDKGQTGFVRFSGGVAAVFPFSTYERTSRGKVATIPAGTVFHLDLRPARPGDVQFDEVTTPPAYNAVSAPSSAVPRARSLATGEEAQVSAPVVKSERSAQVATAQRRDDVPRSLARGGEVKRLSGPQKLSRSDKMPVEERAEVVEEKSVPRIQRLTPWSEGALRERVLDGLMDEMVVSAAASVMKPAK